MTSLPIHFILAGFIAALSTAVAAEPARVAKVDVEKTAFIVTMTDGSVLQGAELAGAVFALALPGRGQSEIRIDSVETDPAHPDITLYGMSTRDRTSGQWTNLCKPNAQ